MNIRNVFLFAFIAVLPMTSTGDSSTVKANSFRSLEEKIDIPSQRAERSLIEMLKELKETSKTYDTLKAKADSAIGKYRYKSDTLYSPIPGNNQIWTVRFKWDTSANEWTFDVKFKRQITSF